MAKTSAVTMGWGNSNGAVAKKTIRPCPKNSSDSDEAGRSTSKDVPIGRRVSPEQYRKMKETARQGVPLKSETQTDS